MSFEKLMLGMMEGQQPKSEKKVSVNVDNYKKLKALMGCYRESLESVEESEERIEAETVVSVRLAKFDIEQAKARAAWIKEEIDRLVNE